MSRRLDQAVARWRDVPRHRRRITLACLSEEHVAAGRRHRDRPELAAKIKDSIDAAADLLQVAAEEQT